MRPSYVLVFRPLKKHPNNSRYTTDADVKQAVTSWLQTLDTYFFYAGIHALVRRCDNYLCDSGVYVEVWCVPSATRTQCTHRSKIKGLGIRLFVAIFLKIPSPFKGTPLWVLAWLWRYGSILAKGCQYRCLWALGYVRRNIPDVS